MHLVGTLFGAPVQPNAIQQISSAISSTFMTLIMFSFVYPVIEVLINQVVVSGGGVLD